MNYLMGILFLIFGVSSYGYAALKDPTRPANYQGEVTHYVDHRTPIVNSILIASDRQVAVVNGKFVQVGDTVQDVTITEITEQAVFFKKGDNIFKVLLSPDIIN